MLLCAPSELVLTDPNGSESFPLCVLPNFARVYFVLVLRHTAALSDYMHKEHTRHLKVNAYSLLLYQEQ